MGGFIAGPVIKFSIDTDDFATQVQGALAQVAAQTTAANRAAAQSITSQIANPLIAQAAQLRALYSTGQIGLQALQAQQKNLLALLDQQIAKLATSNDLTNKQLATLKQLTLERERQANALSRGTGVGVTAGTQSALSSVSGPIIANISRLGTGLLGVSGASGAETTAFAGAASGIAAIASGGGVATTVVAGLTVALLAAAGAAAGLAISGGNIAEQFSNVSQRTGISIQNLQVLDAVAKTSGLSLDDITTGFRKFSQAISGSGVGDDGIAGGVHQASAALQILGVTSKDSFTALEQIADAFEKLPDGPTKAATAIALFGRSGLQLIPILNQGRDGVEQFRAIVTQFGPAIDDSAVKSQQNWQIATEKLSLSFDSLKVSATPFLGVLSSMATESAKFLKAMSGDTSGLNEFEKVLLLLSPVGANQLGEQIGKSLSGGLDQSSTSAASFGASMDKASSIAESAAKNLSPQLKSLNSLFDGSAEALQKLIAEGTKELQALNDEQAKAALTQLGGFNTAGQTAGQSASDALFTKQREDLEAIANIVLQFPQYASQAQSAVAAVTATTVAGLQKLADEALEKLNQSEDQEFTQQTESQTKISNALKSAYDQLAVDQASAAQGAVAKIIADSQKMYDDLAKQLNAAAAGDQAYADLRVLIDADANAKIAKARQEEVEKTTKQVEEEAGKLFDALISSGGNFTKQLKSTLENLLLSPVKSVFSAVVGGVLTQPVQAAKDTLTGFGTQLKNSHKTGILHDIGQGLAPNSAIGSNTNALTDNTKALIALGQRLGVGTNGSGSSGGLLPGTGPGGLLNPLTDQLPLGNVGVELANLGGGVQALPLPLGNVSQELSNLTGVLTGTNVASSTAPNALGTILSNLTNVLTGNGPRTTSGSGVGLFGGAGAGSLIFHGFGGSGGGAGGSIATLASNPLGALGSLIGPALTTGALFASGARGISPALGGLGGILASGVLGNSKASISGLLKDPSSQGTLGLLGLAVEGGGIALAGNQKGGILGGLEGAGGGALGGAALGSILLPGIGTAIGAGIGAIAGFLGGIFGSHGPTQAQINTAMKNQYVDPNTFVGEEFDRSAQSTIGQTLSTNFSSGPGGTFGNASGPGAPPPPPPLNGWGNPVSAASVTINVNAMDSKGVAQFVQQYGPTIAKAVGGQINSTQSGVARAVRIAISPA